MDSTNMNAANDFNTSLKQLLAFAKSKENRLTFTELKEQLEGVSMTGSQINQLWRFLDVNHILVFQIDEDDVLYTGVKDTQTITVTSKQAEPEKKSSPFSFFRRK